MLSSTMKDIFNYLDPKKNLYIYCIWVLILTILFALNLFPFSLLYSSILCILFTIPYQIYISSNILGFKISTIILEIIMFIINYYMHFYHYNLNLIEPIHIAFNIILFVIYNIFLLINGTTFYKHYFKNDLKIK